MSSRATQVQSPESFVLGIFLLLPLAWLVAFWSLVVHARVRVGVWPVAQHGNPFDGTFEHSTIDPRVLGLHTVVVWMGLLALQFLVPLTLLALLLSIFVRSLRPKAPLLQCFVWSVLAALLTVLVDPGGYWLWFLD